MRFRGDTYKGSFTIRHFNIAFNFFYPQDFRPPKSDAPNLVKIDKWIEFVLSQ